MYIKNKVSTNGKGGIMFGFFKEKNFSFECPTCSRSYTAKFDPSDITEFDYPHWHGAGYVAKQNCEYCKTEMTLALSKEGELRSYDDAWENVRDEQDNKIMKIDDEVSELEDQISELEDEIEEDTNIEKINKNIEKLNKKIEQLNSKNEKLEDSFEKKEEKYYDRQERWQEKWQNKLEKMEG